VEGVPQLLVEGVPRQLVEVVQQQLVEGAPQQLVEVVPAAEQVEIPRGDQQTADQSGDISPGAVADYNSSPSLADSSQPMHEAGLHSTLEEISRGVGVGVFLVWVGRLALGALRGSASGTGSPIVF
jgi:hypothetical protein